MKKFLSLLLIFAILTNITAQNATKTQVRSSKTLDDPNLTLDVPNDPTIKTGTFSNGLKYYIKNNGKPADKLELRLAINAGSILEDDDQQGLAHFMEHMCFNGTKNFKKNELVDYLQSIGVKFGAHLNAYTSFDETVYMLSIPSDDEEELEKGFQILEDWAFNVLLTTEEINNERGVIIEEYRTRLGARTRMMKNYLPKLLYKSKYAERLPIGKKEIIENFNPDAMRRYYKDWYRPDLMSVIVVGDIDVDVLETKVKAHFDKKNSVENPRERKIFRDENHKETFISIESDDEAVYSQIQLIYKNPEIHEIDNSIEDMKKRIINSLFSTMINNRLGELRNLKNPPFVYGYTAYRGSYVKNKKSFQSYATANGKDYLSALKALLEENERVKRFGFQKGELERAKISLLAGIDKKFENKDKQESKNLIRPMLNNFLEGDAMPSIEWKHEFYHKVLPNIQLSEVNSLINNYIRKDNRVVIITGKEKTVTEKQVLDLFTSVENDKTIKPYEDKEVKESLFDALPKKGTIIKEEKNEKLDITTITLNNGINIHFKKTDFKDDQVLFKCESKGGNSLLNTSDYLESKLAIGALTSAGVAGLDKNDLKRFMTGKIASVRPYIGNKSEGMTGTSTPKDLETMFQLIHLNFTQLNKDDDAFSSYVKKKKGALGNLLANPQYFFNNEFAKFQYKGYDRFTGYPTIEAYDTTNYDLAYEIYQKRFENAADFNFFFIGNFDVEKLKEYAQQYLASLPATKERENYKDDYFFPIAGEHLKTVYRGKEPKSTVKIIYRGKSEYNKKDKMSFKALKEILAIKLIEKLREEESGVYSPRVSSNYSQLSNSYNLSVSFTCSPKNANKLIKISKETITNIIKEGPEEKDLNKAKEAFLLSRKESLEKNGFWLSVISNYVFFEKDLIRLYDYDKLVNNITKEEIQDVSKRFLSKGAVVGILLPEKK